MSRMAALEMVNAKTLGHGGSVHLDDEEEKEDPVVRALGEEVAKLPPVTLLFLKKIGLQYRFSSACQTVLLACTFVANGVFVYSTYVRDAEWHRRRNVAVWLWFLSLYFLLDSLVCVCAFLPRGFEYIFSGPGVVDVLAAAPVVWLPNKNIQIQWSAFFLSLKMLKCVSARNALRLFHTYNERGELMDPNSLGQTIIVTIVLIMLTLTGLVWVLEHLVRDVWGAFSESDLQWHDVSPSPSLPVLLTNNACCLTLGARPAHGSLQLPLALSPVPLLHQLYDQHHWLRGHLSQG